MRISTLTLTAAFMMIVAGCTTTRPPVLVPKNVVVEIPSDLLRCARVRYPAFDKLTDKQVARLLVQMDSIIKQCRLNMDAIKKFQDEAKRRVEG